MPLFVGEVKQYLQDSMKLNKNIKLISNRAIYGLRSYKLRKIFKKLDEVANSVARRKPIGDVADDCMPVLAPAPVPGEMTIQVQETMDQLMTANGCFERITTVTTFQLMEVKMVTIFDEDEFRHSTLIQRKAA